MPSPRNSDAPAQRSDGSNSNPHITVQIIKIILAIDCFFLNGMVVSPESAGEGDGEIGWMAVSGVAARRPPST